MPADDCGLLVSGCGNSGNAGGNADGTANSGHEQKGPIFVTAGSLNKNQFIKRADAICEMVAEDVRRMGKKYAYEQIDRLKVLGAPSGDGHKIAAMLEALRHGLDKARAASANSPQTSNELLSKAARRGAAYGFKHCGRVT